MRLDTQREGYALALVLLVTIVLTGGALTAYSLTTTEHWQGDDRQEQLTAFLMAQEGLRTFFHRSQGKHPTHENCEPVDLGYAGTEVQVCTYLMRNAYGNEPELWAVHATARRKVSNNPNLPPAARSVAQIAYWQPAEFLAEAGLKSLGGVKKNGNAGEINGNDQCGKKAPLPALAVPKYPKYEDKHPGVLKTELTEVDEKGNVVKKRIHHIGEDPWDAADHLTFDWKGIAEGRTIRPDIRRKGSDGWVDPTTRTAKEWPVVFYEGDLSGKPNGQGILIVTGNLTINGGAEWKGIVLIGGSLISNGNNTLAGATVAGLNAVYGQAVAESQIDDSDLNGKKVITYNSCHIESALEGFSSLTPYNNAWMDAWPVVPPADM